MFNELSRYAVKPSLYAPGTHSLWDDEHVSNGMLEAHLNPHLEAATRKHEFLDKSVNWIAKTFPPSQYKTLLDLGCGPGLYAEHFNSVGYTVTGIDFSKRSIEYAKEQALLNKSNIEYIYQNYLSIEYAEQFDLTALIYCDYGALSITDRTILSKKVYQALKPNGKFVLDVFTQQKRKKETRSWYHSEKGGFFSPRPHIYMESTYQYDNNDKTELDQYIVLTEDGISCYHVWNHYFTKEALVSEMQIAGFNDFEIFGDIAGVKFSVTGDTICGVFKK